MAQRQGPSLSRCHFTIYLTTYTNLYSRFEQNSNKKFLHPGASAPPKLYVALPLHKGEVMAQNYGKNLVCLQPSILECCSVYVVWSELWRRCDLWVHPRPPRRGHVQAAQTLRPAGQRGSWSTPCGGCGCTVSIGRPLSLGRPTRQRSELLIILIVRAEAL